MIARAWKVGWLALWLSLTTAYASAEPAFQVQRAISMDLWVEWPAPAHWDEESVVSAFPEWMKFVTEDELEAVQDAGLDTIRLPIEPAYLLHNADDATRRGVILAGIKSAIDRLLAHDFNVILDLHTIPRSEPGVAGIDQIMQNPAVFDRYKSLVEAIAAGLWHYPADRVALEIINEPTLSCDNPGEQAVWAARAKRLFAVARKASPERTLIISGACWGSADGLSKMDPAAFDANVIWTFHSYEPFAITHQGANWIGDLTRHYRDLPYPPYQNGPSASEAILARNEARVRNATSGIAEQDSLGLLRDTMRGFNNAEALDAKLREPFETAARWADANDVARAQIFIGEFGMIGREWQSDLDIKDEWRVAYMRDIINLAEEYGFAWSVWSFGGAFGVMQGFGGKPLDNPLFDDLFPSVNN